MMIIMVRDGMGWFTRRGLISYLSVDYGWSIGLKMMIITVRDGMGWFTRWGLLWLLLVNFGWSYR